MIDTRLWQQGAYVTDGRELYQVLGYRNVGSIAIHRRRWLDVENCRTGLIQHFSEADVIAHLRLIRAAPPQLPPAPEPST